MFFFIFFALIIVAIGIAKGLSDSTPKVPPQTLAGGTADNLLIKMLFFWLIK